MKYFIIKLKESVLSIKLANYEDDEISTVLFEEGEYKSNFRFIPYGRDIKKKVDIYEEWNSSMIIISERLKELFIKFETPYIDFFDLRFTEGQESKHEDRALFTPVKEPYYMTSIEEFPIENLDIDYKNSVFEYNNWEPDSSWTFFPISFDNHDAMVDFKKDIENVQSIRPVKLIFKNASKIPAICKLFPYFNFWGGDRFLISESLKQELEEMKITGIGRFLEVGYKE